jgi:hypothetical protein
MPMRHPIFDSVDRTLATPRGHEESTFAFYNRVCGAYWSPVRDILQDWADGLPEEDYVDSRARLRSGDDDQFNSAYFELYLHESLRRAGYKITVHPQTPSGRRPDFYAWRADGGFYLEAIAPAPSLAARASSARLARVYRVLEETNVPNWQLWIEEVESADASPPAAKLRSEIRAWLSRLDPAEHAEISSRPQFEWEAAGWRVALSAIPVPPDAKGSHTRRSIGVYPMSGGGIDNSLPIIQALGKKDRAYGDLPEPLVIAIGVYQVDRDRWAIQNALWGHEAVQLPENPKDPGMLVRDPDGYFGAPDTWLHTNVSGVLVVNRLGPARFLSAEASLWVHPAPARQLTNAIGWPFESTALTPAGLETTPPAILPWHFFDLPEAWPPGEAFPRHRPTLVSKVTT